MKELRSYKSIFAKPFTVTKVEIKTKDGFATMTQKAELTELEVLSHCNEMPELKPGDKILVRSDAFNQPWSRNKLRYQNIEFVMVPLEFVQAVKPL